jgi:membrane-bound lytic murein transglycosylase B
MNRGSQFKLLTIAVLVALVWLPVKASAAQCGSTAAGFEAWKRQFAAEALARGVSASTIAALMVTNYSTATIAADVVRGAFLCRSINFLRSAAARPSSGGSQFRRPPGMERCSGLSAGHCGYWPTDRRGIEPSAGR